MCIIVHDTCTSKRTLIPFYKKTNKLEAITNQVLKLPLLCSTCKMMYFLNIHIISIINVLLQC